MTITNTPEAFPSERVSEIVDHALLEGEALLERIAASDVAIVVSSDPSGASSVDDYEKRLGPYRSRVNVRFEGYPADADKPGNTDKLVARFVLRETTISD